MPLCKHTFQTETQDPALAVISGDTFETQLTTLLGRGGGLVDGCSTWPREASLNPDPGRGDGKKPKKKRASGPDMTNQKPAQVSHII